MKKIMKEEAIKRMEILKLEKSVIKNFKEKDVVYYSEHQNEICDGMLYWVSNDDKYVQMIKEFEQEYNALVYHCILTHTSIGDLFSMLYVSSYDYEDFDYEREELADGYCLACVHNLTYGDIDIGTIKVAPMKGGLTRLQ
jgi:hypothetical protein